MSEANQHSLDLLPLDSQPVQLGLELKNIDPLSKRYLVVHSGISKAITYINNSIKELQTNFSIADSSQPSPAKYFVISIIGEKGSGKTHILNYSKYEAEQSNINLAVFDDLDLNSDKDADYVSSFVSQYEKIKVSGGIVVVSYSQDAYDFNQHIKTRLTNSESFNLEKPEEKEFKQILVSLFKRDNFNLSEKTLNYVLSRIPANTLSFLSLSDKLKHLSEQYGKQAKFYTVRDIIKEK